MINYPTRNWLRILFLFRGTVVPRVAGRTLFCVLLAAAAVYAKSHGVDLGVPDITHKVIAVALGLLLVFRTTTSYDRYWEGRKLLGGMVNHTRDLGRQVACFLEEGSSEKGRAARYVVALYVTIRRYLRHEREWPELAELLDKDEHAQLAEHRAPPLLVARLLTDLFANAANEQRLSEQRLMLIDHNLTTLMGLWGGAERIVKTPVPFAYAHFIKLFLMLYCTTLPLALLSTSGWYTMAGVGVVSFGLFGIDEIGVEIEDPFGYDANDLPLDAIGETIATDVLQVAGV